MNTGPEHHRAAWWRALLEPIAWLGATTWGRTPRIARLHDGVGAGRYLHSEWGALLERFVAGGLVEYRTLTRVQRLFEAYLEGLADTDPEGFADADDQLAFYLNAYNALAIYQVVQHYPVRSIREIPDAFLRVYPVGQRNLSLTMLHGVVVRVFGDGRVHAALCPAARGAPLLQSEPYVGPQLQTQLDTALCSLLADPQRGARYDRGTNTLWLAAVLHRWGGDLVYPHLMPSARSLLLGRLQPQRLLDALLPYMPPELAAAVQTEQPTVRPLPFDWTLNEQP
jgi:hypothetical protein